MADKDVYKSQYAKAFRKRRGLRQLGVRPSSPRRKNNPHPIQDFLIYNRLPEHPDTNVRNMIAETVMANRLLGPPDPGIQKRIPETVIRRSKSATVPPLVNPTPLQVSDSTSDNPHWSEWTTKAHTLTTPPVRPGPPRPHTTVGAHIRGEFVTQESDQSALKTKTKTKSTMNSRPPSYVEQVIARSLSPRRQPGAPGMPGRSYTHYHGYRVPVSCIGALDLQAPNYNYATGHQYPISNYTVYGPPPKEVRPMHKRKSSRFSNDDYVHDHSVFTSTMPQVTGYYIIHPDWVSERASLRRSRSLMSVNA